MQQRAGQCRIPGTVGRPQATIVPQAVLQSRRIRLVRSLCVDQIRSDRHCRLRCCGLSRMVPFPLRSETARPRHGLAPLPSHPIASHEIETSTESIHTAPRVSGHALQLQHARHNVQCTSRSCAAVQFSSRAAHACCYAGGDSSDSSTGLGLGLSGVDGSQQLLLMTSAADIHSLRYATPDDIDEADLEDELNALEAEMVHCSALRDR